MKVLHTNFHRGWGGQPARILMLSSGLKARGHEVTLAVPSGSVLAARARDAGLETFEDAAFRKPKHLLSALSDVRRLAAHLRTSRHDLIDAHGSQDLWTAVLARRLAGASMPLVLTRHNTKRVAFHPANRWLFQHVDHLIVVSRSILERYEPFFARGDMRRDRVSVVHSAYDPKRFHPGISREPLRKALGLGPDARVIGVIGRLVRDKGQDDFLRAAAAVRQRDQNAVFLLAGTGTAEPSLRDLAQRLDLQSAVRFLGFRDDMPQVTAALDVSVLPSVDCDASPAVLKEALACGVPAVATDIGGASEIIRSGETGLVVPPRDPTRLAAAILSLLENPDRARAMGERGSRDVAERFTPDRLTDGTIAAYEAALRTSAPSPGGTPRRRAGA